VRRVGVKTITQAIARSKQETANPTYTGISISWSCETRLFS
jgi:hypothetical protein